MLAKLRLDQTKKYEQALAAYEIAVMLVDFALGRKHYMRIGSEQGGISKWDDIVIENGAFGIEIRWVNGGLMLAGKIMYLARIWS